MPNVSILAEKGSNSSPLYVQNESTKEDMFCFVQMISAHPVLPSVLQPNVCAYCVVVVPFAKMQQPSNPVTAAAVRYKEGHHKDVHVCVSTSLRCSGWPVDVVVVPISTGECHIYTPNGKQQ